MKALPYIILKNAVVVALGNGEQHTISASHLNFKRIVQAIKDKKWELIKELVDVKRTIAQSTQGRVKVTEDGVTYDGLPVHGTLAERMVDLLRAGFDIAPWIKFMEKLWTNPDPFSITQLYNFLERATLPLCPDGDFLAYKYVNYDYMDCHSRSFDNSPGKVVELDRATCDNNPDNHCSAGLHFCSRGYLPNTSPSAGGLRTVIVKVNPRDVVSVPNDHNCEKARSCRYEVVGELDVDTTFEDMESNQVLDRSWKTQPRDAGGRFASRG